MLLNKGRKIRFKKGRKDFAIKVDLPSDEIFFEISTVEVTITLVIFESVCIMHVLVFIVNPLPGGTSGLSAHDIIVT